jgi:hypothetical protein
MTNPEYQQAIFNLSHRIFSREELIAWANTSHHFLHGDCPAQAIQKGQFQNVHQLLLTVMKGH